MFANHPAWAKERKIALTQDGAVFETTFDEHCQLIDQIVRAEFYKSTTTPEYVVLSSMEQFVVDNY
ncbi:hypothetical protein QVM56_32700, partial [Pseudomonas aeruginosa]|uniref:hypothetical protein n=1 Tax=Pseudomonas aeruginosa TaxID=287 RepID=UPI0035253742